jgi:hypothetical protein
MNQTKPNEQDAKRPHEEYIERLARDPAFAALQATVTGQRTLLRRLRGEVSTCRGHERIDR